MEDYSNKCTEIKHKADFKLKCSLLYTTHTNCDLHSCGCSRAIYKTDMNKTLCTILIARNTTEHNQPTKHYTAKSVL